MRRAFRIIREYNSNDVEIYKLEKYDDCETIEQLICYFMILDTHRKPRLEDFPHLKGIISEDDIEADNFIKAFIVSSKNLNEELSEQICGIIEELTFHSVAPSLEWNPIFNVVTKEELEKMLCDKNYLFKFFDNYLNNESCNFTIVSSKDEDYNNLSQRVSTR